ncbi:MAG: hypothetical protein AAGC46_10345 [Solirubrobacteraceae bacterium]|nr:hypothetical protein [Patulibacter sp.]
MLLDYPGERRALENLRSDGGLVNATPAIQIVGGKSRPLSANAVREQVKRLVPALDGQMFYLDFVRAKPDRLLSFRQEKLTTAALVYMQASKRGLRFIPVLGISGSDRCLNAVADAAMTEGRGAALRVPLLGKAVPGGKKLSALINDRVAKMGLDRKDVDLWFDLGYLTEDFDVPARRIERMLEGYVASGSWRRVVLTGGSMPSSLGAVPENSTRFLPRREWQLWSKLSSGLRDGLDYGDYGIQNPRPPAIDTKRGGIGRSNIRYTTEDRYLIARGKGPTSQVGTTQYAGLCRDLMRHKCFRSADYSWGDKVISLCGDELIEPETQGMWRAAGMAHHITLAQEQLSS